MNKDYLFFYNFSKNLKSALYILSASEFYVPLFDLTESFHSSSLCKFLNNLI